jgi:hypothetical protein
MAPYAHGALSSSVQITFRPIGILFARRRQCLISCPSIERPNRAALLVLGNVALVRGEPARALQLFDESIALHYQFADAWGLSILLTLAAVCDCSVKRSH